MCGITGFYSTTGYFDKDDLRHMTDALRHRGPDAEGYFSDEIVGMGHRRLSIIDLSSRANQPMTSQNDRYVLIYNGEIYNYSEVGAMLKTVTAHDHQINFKTSSDTEVILEAFNIFGTEFVNHINGMYALAIYDKELNDLYLFRDRIGIKPLFYYWDGNNLAFGSELKSILKIKKLPRKINKAAIKDFLHLGYIPAPHTIYKNFFKLNSGCFLKVSKNGLSHHKYWSIKNKIYSDVLEDSTQALVKLSDLLMSSVQYQLKSDVPFGVFLSGGVDSSLITAQAVELSSVKVNTFSIGFEENSHNESEYAKAIAKYLGTDHHEFIVSCKDAIDLIDSIFLAYDEPFADSSAIPTMLVSKMAKDYVTVTLSGEGGDELFLGYGAYKWAQRLDNPLLKLTRKSMAKIFSNLSSRYKRAGKLLEYKNESYIKSHIFSQEQYLFSEMELETILMNGFNTNSDLDECNLTKSYLSNVRNNNFLNNGNIVKERKLNSMEIQALFDLHYYLQDDLLVKVDRASMYYSLETRVPYLDHRVIEFALNLSPHLKYKDGISKYILKEILYQYIPKKYFDRPKQGFAIPLAYWLRHQFHFLINDYLSQEIIEKYNIIKYEEVDKLKKLFVKDVDYVYNRIWLLIVLHKWLDMNNVDIEN